MSDRQNIRGLHIVLERKITFISERSESVEEGCDVLRPLLFAGLVGLGDHEAGVWAEALQLAGRGDGVGGVALGGEDEEASQVEVIKSAVDRLILERELEDMREEADLDN